MRRSARRRNAERQAHMELMAVQKRLPPPAFGQQLYKALDGAGFVFGAETRIQQLDGLRQSLLSAYERGERPVSPSAKRIMVTGCPIGGVLDKIVGAGERLGGAVVCYENCASIKASRRLVDADAPDIVCAIAERYLDIGCAVMTPDDIRMELLRQLTDEYAVDGIIEVDLQAARPMRSKRAGSGGWRRRSKSRSCVWKPTTPPATAGRSPRGWKRFLKRSDGAH